MSGSNSCTALALLNAHPRDLRIRLEEETHTYYIDGRPGEYTSTTTFVKKHFPEFNADAVISSMMRKASWSSSKYFGMSREAIKQAWQDTALQASTAGTAMHLNLERYYNGDAHSTDGREWELFCQFLRDFPELKPYRTEMLVFDEEARIAGSVDMIFHDPAAPGQYLIYDWKRCSSMPLDNRWESGCHPLTEHLPNCKYAVYSLQLHVYKHILQRKYGMQINECVLMVLHPSQESYLRLPCLDLESTVDSLMQARRQS